MNGHLLAPQARCPQQCRLILTIDAKADRPLGFDKVVKVSGNRVTTRAGKHVQLHAVRGTVRSTGSGLGCTSGQ